MRYNVGDRVVIRPDLAEGDCMGTYVNNEMAAMRGEVVEILEAFGTSYNVRGSVWYWTDDMFSGLEREVFGDDDLDNADISAFVSYVEEIAPGIKKVILQWA